MNNLRTLIFLMFMSMVFLGCEQQKQETREPEAQLSQDPEEVRKIIEEKNARIQEWYNTGEIDSIAEHFSENSIQMPPNMTPLRGREHFKEVWKENIAAGKWEFNLKTQDVRTCGDLATELGKYSLKFTPNDGVPIPPMDDNGNYVVLWEKIDGDWQIVWDAPVSENPIAMAADSVGIE